MIKLSNNSHKIFILDREMVYLFLRGSHPPPPPPPPPSTPTPKAVVGADVGLEVFAPLSYGEPIETPDFSARTRSSREKPRENLQNTRKTPRLEKDR